MQVSFIEDPEGHIPKLKVTSEADEHIGHSIVVYGYEINDAFNFVEWWWCYPCDKEFRFKEVSVAQEGDS